MDSSVVILYIYALRPVPSSHLEVMVVATLYVGLYSGHMRRLRRDILELCERAQLAGDWLREDALTCPLEADELHRAWLAGLTVRRGYYEHRLTERGRLALLRARSE
jgi:hypothetical protein